MMDHEPCDDECPACNDEDHGACERDCHTDEDADVLFEPVELEVVDLTIVRRKITIASLLCPGCGNNLTDHHSLTLQQYEYSIQTTDLRFDDWSGDELGDGGDYLPLAWQCSNCHHVIAEGSES